MEMSILSLFTFAGGLGLLLLGMRELGDAIARQAGGRMRLALGRLVSGRAAGVLLGAGVTAVIQSSGAATVMVLGFVDSGALSLETAAGPILGANVGTTATGWLLALGDGSARGGSLLRLLHPNSLSALLAFAGVLLQLLCRREGGRDLGRGLLGFGVLLLGMATMSGALAPLRSSGAFRALLRSLDSPLLGVPAGFLMGAVLQSSSAAAGVVQAAASGGSVCAGSALPLLMGINIGAGLIVLAAAAGLGPEARRAAWTYMLHNVLAMLTFLGPLLLLGAMGAPWLRAPLSARGVALLHTVYKAASAALQLPFVPQILNLTDRIVPRQTETAP